MSRLAGWLGLPRSKFYDWRRRYGLANEHNALVPRDFWLEDWERAAIVVYARSHRLEGYRRLAFMMLDDGVVAVSPSSVYRVLLEAELMRRWERKLSKKGTGFTQPLRPHEHWHVDVTYINICATFYYPPYGGQPARRLLPLHRPLGDPRIDDRARRGNHRPAGTREIPRGLPADHLRQRPPVHRQGLQGVHLSCLRRNWTIPPRRLVCRPLGGLAHGGQTEEVLLRGESPHSAAASRREGRGLGPL